jgi:hypothetical protein
MNFLLVLADETPGWVRQLLQPDILALAVPLAVIIGGITYSVVHSIMRHRERMAKIEHGIDPDAGSKPR